MKARVVFVADIEFAVPHLLWSTVSKSNFSWLISTSRQLLPEKPVYSNGNVLAKRVKFFTPYNFTVAKIKK
jgi:hypothetical protein